MNVGLILCGILAVFFLVLAGAFLLLKGKAAMLISGFNTLPKEQRALYSHEKMSAAYRNMFLLWGAVFVVGAALAHWIHAYTAIAAFGVWLVLLGKELHMYADKAFEKFKK